MLFKLVLLFWIKKASCYELFFLFRSCEFITSGQIKCINSNYHLVSNCLLMQQVAVNNVQPDGSYCKINPFRVIQDNLDQPVFILLFLYSTNARLQYSWTKTNHCCLVEVWVRGKRCSSDQDHQRQTELQRELTWMHFLLIFPGMWLLLCCKAA